MRRDADRSAQDVGHPLLSSLGRDTRELRRTLGGLGGTGEVVDDVLAPTPAPDTLLGRLQHDLRHDHEPTGAERARRVLAASDRSVQVHAAHGSARQVEVLRDVLVGLLDDDPTLEPRDIVVLCPDIDVYAPLFHAAFGLGGVVGPGEGGHPAHRLRLRLADRGLAADQPVPRPRRRPARPRLRARDAERDPRARGERPGQAPVRARRRRPRHHRHVGRGRRGPVGSDRVPARGVRARRGRGQHVARRAGPAAGRGRRRRVRHPARQGAAARRRGQRPGRPRRPARRARRPGRGRRRGAARRRRPRGAGSRCSRDAVHALGSASPQDAWQVAQLERELAAGGRRRDRREVGLERAAADAARPARPARGPHRRAPHPRQLPHRRAHRVHDGADALGAAPRRRARRPRRRPSSPARPPSTATTSSVGTR